MKHRTSLPLCLFFALQLTGRAELAAAGCESTPTGPQFNLKKQFFVAVKSATPSNLIASIVVAEASTGTVTGTLDLPANMSVWDADVDAQFKTMHLLLADSSGADIVRYAVVAFDASNSYAPTWQVKPTAMTTNKGAGSNPSLSNLDGFAVEQGEDQAWVLYGVSPYYPKVLMWIGGPSRPAGGSGSLHPTNLTLSAYKDFEGMSLGHYGAVAGDKWCMAAWHKTTSFFVGDGGIVCIDMKSGAESLITLPNAVGVKRPAFGYIAADRADNDRLWLSVDVERNTVLWTAMPDSAAAANELNSTLTTPKVVVPNAWAVVSASAAAPTRRVLYGVTGGAWGVARPTDELCSWWSPVGRFPFSGRQFFHIA